jgi:hypothetical protein
MTASATKATESQNVHLDGVCKSMTAQKEPKLSYALGLGYGPSGRSRGWSGRPADIPAAPASYRRFRSQRGVAEIDFNSAEHLDAPTICSGAECLLLAQSGTSLVRHRKSAFGGKADVYLQDLERDAVPVWRRFVAAWERSRAVMESRAGWGLPIHWFRPHTRSGREISLVLPCFAADNCCGSRGTVRVPMLVRILRTYQLPEILMVAAATLFVVVSAAYWWGG